jgi:hypothetical protein
MDNLGVLKPAVVQTGPGIKMKMILKVMYDNDYSVKFKARLVACGYSQVYLRDYADTYSPTVPISVVFISICVALHRDLLSGSFDVTAAFLKAYNDFKNYAYIPEGVYPGGKRFRVSVIKAMYGKKQAPKL